MRAVAACCKTGDTRWAEHHLARVLPEYVHNHLLLRTVIQFWNSWRFCNLQLLPVCILAPLLPLSATPLVDEVAGACNRLPGTENTQQPAAGGETSDETMRAVMRTVMRYETQGRYSQSHPASTNRNVRYMPDTEPLHASPCHMSCRDGSSSIT